MPNNQTNEDSKLIDRDREVDEILEESKYLLDQEKMELTAQKYRAKQPVAEIFSNADKKPRLENSNPLDVDKEQTVNENDPLCPCSLSDAGWRRSFFIASFYSASGQAASGSAPRPARR